MPNIADNVENDPKVPVPSLELSQEQKFEALLARFQCHVEALHSLTDVDLRVLGGFMTLQLALAAWLTDHAPTTAVAKWGLVAISSLLTAVAVNLLYNGYRRRKEVVAGLTNTKSALRFDKVGIYLIDNPLDPKTTFRPWWPSYIVVCCLTLVAVVVMALFGGFAHGSN